MTSPGARPEFSIEADLVLEVDGVEATVIGTGSDVTVRADDPIRVWASLSKAALPSGVGGVDGPRAMGRVADILHEQGLTVHIDGPRGRLLSLGDARPSAAGRLTTGSAHLRFGSLSALAPVLVERARRRPAVVAVCALIIGGVVAVLARRRH